MMYRYIMLIVIFFAFLSVFLSCGNSENSDKAELKSGHGTHSVSAELTFTPHASWEKEKPRGSMRKAQFKLPGEGQSGDAELAVFVFPGSGGGVQANIDRWIGQFRQPDGSNSSEKTEIEKTSSNGLPVTLIYVTGTYLGGSMGGPMGGTTKELPGSAMLAAIVKTSSDPWFFKAVGPQTTIDHWRKDFESFAKTFKQE